MLKTCRLLPKWRIFAKSGHTESALSSFRTTSRQTNLVSKTTSSTSKSTSNAKRIIPYQIGGQTEMNLNLFWVNSSFQFILSSKQCDLLARLFFNIWPLATLKICPIMYQICHGRLTILPNKKRLPKISQRNFAKSGHTGSKKVPATSLITSITVAKNHRGEVVVAQLVERSLLIPEVRGSTPVIGKILLSICLLSAVLKRRK